MKKISVDFDGQQQGFRLVHGYTFGNLLEDSCKHWALDIEDYELQDEDGCTWPASGVVQDETTNNELSHEIGLQHPWTPPQIYLVPLNSFSNYSATHQSCVSPYNNPPPSLASSLSFTPNSFGSIPSLNTQAGSNINLPDLEKIKFGNNQHIVSPTKTSSTDSSTVETSANQAALGTSKAITIPKPSQSRSGQLSPHQRVPSKSDAVRKLIEENRLSPTINSASASMNIGQTTFHLLPISNNTFDNTKTQNIPESPSSVKTASSYGPVRTSSPCTIKPAEDLTGPTLSSSSDSMNAGNSESTNHVRESETNAFRDQQPVLAGRRSSISQSAATHSKAIETSTGVKSDATTFSCSTETTASSDLSRSAAIRLRKAYDNVTVDEKIADSRIQLGPTTHKDVILEWESPPKCVLIIKKRQEPGITELLKSMTTWLQEEKGIKVLIEESVVSELPYLEAFCPNDPIKPQPDIVICLGGDGTVLHANTLFQSSMPPLMAFNLGSLGFLTPFRIRNYKKSITSVMNQCRLTLRSRLFCIVVKHIDGAEVLKKRTVLNEVVVDRGYSPYLSNLECFCDNVPITNIQADGIIVSSTTGSTAYSLSAGGSMVHPQVPAILFTPICPHSLSFRPLLFPDSVELKIQVPEDSRSTAWVSFDGREQTELNKGDHIIIRISKWPFVWIRDSDGVGDWVKSLADCLHWNDRRKQKPLSTPDQPATSSYMP